MLEATVDRLGGPVGRAGALEVGQDVGGALLQGPAKGGDLAQRGWDAMAEGLDEFGHHRLAPSAVRFTVGGDRGLVDAPGDLDLHVGVVREQRFDPLVLSVGEQVGPGVQGPRPGWDLDHPGYDRVTGCIDWPQDQWAAFEAWLLLLADRHGYFCVRDPTASAYIGHAHYEVDVGVAHIGINLVPEVRGSGLGVAVLTLLITRVWADSAATHAINECEDDRTPAFRTHRRCGFVPDADTRSDWGRPTRTWRLARPDTSSSRTVTHDVRQIWALGSSGDVTRGSRSWDRSERGSRRWRSS